MTERMIKSLEIMALKETLLAQIVTWIKAKGLWEDCKRDIGYDQTIEEK